MEATTREDMTQKGGSFLSLYDYNNDENWNCVLRSVYFWVLVVNCASDFLSLASPAQVHADSVWAVRP